MRETAASLEVKARAAELRKKLLQLRDSRKSPNPNGGKNDRQSVSDEDIEALIRDTDIALANAMNITPTITNSNVATAVASAVAAAASPTTAQNGKENVAPGTKPVINGSVVGTGLSMAESAQTAATDADETEAEIDEDLRDWLLFTNFYDKAYRTEFLSVHRRAATRRAALEAIEAQKQKLLEEMEQDNMVLGQFGPKTAGWASKKPAVSPSPSVTRFAPNTGAPTTSSPGPSQRHAATAQDVVAAPIASIAPVATAPDIVATPAVPAPAAAAATVSTALPTVPVATSAPNRTGAVVAAAAVTTAAKIVTAAPISTAPSAATSVVPVAAASAATNITAPISAAANSKEVSAVASTTAPVVPAAVSANTAVSTAPIATSPKMLHPERQALVAGEPPQRSRNQQKTKPSKRPFDENTVKAEETIRPSKTARTGMASKNKAQANHSPKSAPKGGAVLIKFEKDVVVQKSPSLKPAPKGAGGTPFFEDTHPTHPARTDKSQQDKAHANVPSNPISAVTENANQFHVDTNSGFGEIRIRGTASNGPNSPAQGTPWFAADGGSSTNITIAGLARTTRPFQVPTPNSKAADVKDEEPKSETSLESRVVRPEKGPLEDKFSKSLHERVTKPLVLGRRGENMFFFMWSYNRANIKTSQRDGLWVTRVGDRAMINRAFDTCRNVIFFFTVHRSEAFQGYARMASQTMDSQPRSEWMKHIPWPTTSPFRIEWLNTATTSFRKVEYLKNPLNDGASVTSLIKDRAEIEEECARGLIKEMDASRDQLRISRSSRNNRYDTDRPYSREGRSPSYVHDDYPQDYENERAGFEDSSPINAYRRRSSDRGMDYGDDDYGSGYSGGDGGGGGGGGGYDRWVPGDSFRPQSWR